MLKVSEDIAMDAKVETLRPASELAAEGPIRIPGESAAYRAARTALLAQEIELRRHIEAVAAQRRNLPEGAVVTDRYRFEGEDGPSDLAGLFRDKTTLITYTAMYGPQRAGPCPMCTNLVDGWDGNAADVNERASLVFIAPSPLPHLLAWKRDRGWRHARVYSDPTGDFQKDWFGLTPDGQEVPALNVFTRRGDTIRHFYTGELTSADPGQDPRGAPDPAPLWTILDLTPEGRGADWYPKLSYDR
jgi:predicted dithiol-disulfide oxidoreductase (DUF899 family)